MKEPVATIDTALMEKLIRIYLGYEKYRIIRSNFIDGTNLPIPELGSIEDIELIYDVCFRLSPLHKEVGDNDMDFGESMFNKVIESNLSLDEKARILLSGDVPVSNRSV